MATPDIIAEISIEFAREMMTASLPLATTMNFHMGRASAAASIEPNIKTLSARNECIFLLQYGHRHNIFKDYQ